MGLFDDVFGKNKINQLKRKLLEKNNVILRLESFISNQVAINNKG
jgi:hypothetical protein